MNSVRQEIIRRLPAFRGKLRLAKYLLGDLQGEAFVKDRYGFNYEVPDLQEPIAFHLLVNGVYEPEVTKLLLRVLKPGGVFIDVGANIGALTIPAAARVGSSGKVVAIEASPEIFKVLQRNVALNKTKNVELICAAAGARDGDTKFYPAPADHFGMGSRAPQFNVRPIIVRSVTIDSLVKQLNLATVDLVKIDVEGFEVEVLEGAMDLLRFERPPLLIFEFCDWAEARRSPKDIGAAQKLLIDLGFKIWRASNYRRHLPLRQPLLTGGDMLVACRH